MNWKIFAVAFASVAFVSFPQNIIGCGPGIDPYDYYTSFFQNDLGNNKSLQPFYYTGFSFLYSEEERISREEVLAQEWTSFAKLTSANAAQDFVNNFAHKDLSNLYYHLERAKPLSIPDSVKKNEFTQYFLKSKDLETLGYLMFAKKAEPFVNRNYNDWEASPVDSSAMRKHLVGGMALHKAAKQEFIKLKYGYQIMRLAFYNRENRDAIQYYDQYIASNTAESIVRHLCTSIKAGALFRTGKAAEASYLFSKSFAATDVKKVSNYISFRWAYDNATGLNDALKFCKSKEEQANLMALYSLSKPGNELKSMQEIFSLFPQSPMLKTLAVREINKLEETLLTPTINTEQGGQAFYFTWNRLNTDSAFAAQKNYAKQLESFYVSAAEKTEPDQKGFYYISAAYVAYMRRGLDNAVQHLKEAERQKLSTDEKDQLALIKLLVNVNKADRIDASFEASILESVQWMYSKAVEERKASKNYSDNRQWTNFYRNFFTEVMAKKYRKQKEFIKESLSVGAADFIQTEDELGEGYFTSGLDFLRNRLESNDVELLYNQMTSPNKSAYDNFLFSKNTIRQKSVVDFAGTAYLRAYDYEKALAWFAKASPKDKNIVIEKDPFIDILYDREERMSNDEDKTSKEKFATEMLRLKRLTTSDPSNAAKHYYKMALGLYNITYYGHAWELVNYYRSGSDGYRIPKDANNFQKEYYGCFAAQDYFKKAMELSSDKEFKARALFMMAKCSQKQLQQPEYDYNADYKTYDQALDAYTIKFKTNSDFPELKNNYGQTKFFNEAFNTCSYLRDYVRAGK